jgi:sulfoquinovosyltransferase
MKISCFFFFILFVSNVLSYIHQHHFFVKVTQPRSLFCKRNFKGVTSPLKYSIQSLCSHPLKVLLLVEPNPFTYVSGYSNRFKETLKYLTDEVRIITAGKNVSAPTNFSGFPIYTVRGFGLPMYKEVRLSLDWEGKVAEVINSFRPDLVHVSVPSAIVFSAIGWTKKFNIPLLMSYHTDLVEYSRSYLPFPSISSALAEFLVRMVLKQADLVLATSPQLQDKIKKLGIENVHVWRKGINTEVNCFFAIL